MEIKNRADLDAMAELIDVEAKFGHEDARKKKTGNNNEKRCFASGYTGYTNGGNVGGIKFTLKGSGVATLNYGNCWDKGIVKLYINGTYQAEAGKKQNKVDYKFAFTKGDVIELKDEDGYDINTHPYTHTYTYIHIYTYIYIHSNLPPPLPPPPPPRTPLVFFVPTHTTLIIISVSSVFHLICAVIRWLQSTLSNSNWRKTATFMKVCSITATSLK